jgi:outer membrane lipoprotein SlyB
MKMSRAWIWLLVVSLAVPALSFAGKVDRTSKNVTISVNYGTIVETGSVQIKSDAGKAAVTGGILGYAAGHHSSGKHQAESAAAGALIAGLIARHKAGKHPANSYTVRRTDGQTIKVIMDHADLRVGDCVSIEEGPSTNLRRVSDTLCSAPVHHEDPHVQASADGEAQECHAAKTLLLEAKGDEEFQRAMQKVKILCE